MAVRKHGMSATREYKTWKGMVERCTKEYSPSWPYYGGRGVRVCERWLTFANFYADMGERPEGKSIDRIDSDGNYEPSNCRWATVKEQHANQHHARGEQNGNSTLTESHRQALLALRGTMSQRKAAALFGIDQAQVWRIWNGQSRVNPTSAGSPSGKSTRRL